MSPWITPSALTGHSSCQTTPQSSFTQPVVRCARKIWALSDVGNADKADIHNTGQ